jgi:hypothetical protein
MRSGINNDIAWQGTRGKVEMTRDVNVFHVTKAASIFLFIRLFFSDYFFLCMFQSL